MHQAPVARSDAPTIDALLRELAQLEHAIPFEPITYLPTLAAALLRRDGLAARLRDRGTTEPRPPAAPDHLAALRWRHITLLLPDDLLRAGLAAFDGGRVPDEVALLHPLLRFDTPTAHLHLHAGADKPSSATWRGAANYALDETAPDTPTPSAPGTSGSIALPHPAAMLVGLCLERLWLSHTARSHGQALTECTACAQVLGNIVALAPAARRALAAVLPKDNEPMSERAAAPPEAASASHEGDDRRDIDRTNTDQMALRSYLTRCLEAESQGEQPAPEDPADFFAALLREDDPQLSALSHEARLTALAGRIAAHRACVTQAPGLTTFQESAVAATRLTKGQVAAPHKRADGLRWSLNLRAEERRVVIERGSSVVKLLTRAAPSDATCERGLIWLISRSAPAREVHDGPSGSSRVGALLTRVVGRRNQPGAARQAKKAQLDHLREALENLSTARGPGGRPALCILRGIDLAGNERQGPLWAYAGLLRELRSGLDKLAAERGLPAPGLTLHAGEDFPSLLTGLRACHEPIVAGLLRPGDRLGHCIALGIDPQRWCGREQPARVPRWERVLDLSWALDRLDRIHEGRREGWIDQRARWEHELTTLLAGYGVTISGDAVLDLHRTVCRLPPSELRAVSDDLPREDPPGTPAALRALKAAARREGAEVEVWPTDEAATLAVLSRAARADLADRLIAIEVCPSSNFTVAGLEGMLDQPNLWRRGLDPTQHDALPICLSADDPVEFATRLEDELAYAFAGLQAGGLAGRFAADWLRDAMETAWRARFTLPACSPHT